MKLDFKKTTLVGFAFLSISMFWGFYDAVIAKMLIDSFGLSQGSSGWIMAIDNIIALILIPLFGIISDRTKSRLGKRTPYIIAGVVIASLFITGVAIVDYYQQLVVIDAGIGPIVATEVGDITKYAFTHNGITTLFDTKIAAFEVRTPLVYAVTMANPGFLIAFIGILLIVLLAMAAYRTPAVSLMPDITPKPLRSKANAIINLMGTIGGIVALLFIGLLAPEFEQYITIFVVLALLMLIILAVYLITVREVKWVREMKELSIAEGVETAETLIEAETKVEKLEPAVMKSFILILTSVFLWFFGFNAVMSKFSVYASTVLAMSNYALPLMVAQGSALIAFVPLGYLATSIGRKKTIIGGATLLSLSMGAAFFLTPTSSFMIYVTMVLAGIGWAAINVNSYPMVVEMSHGSNIGKYTGFYYTASMTAQILTPVISGYLMDMPFMTTLFGGSMKVLFPYAAIFVAASIFTMLLVKHGDSKPIKQSKLEALAGTED